MADRPQVHDRPPTRRPLGPGDARANIHPAPHVRDKAPTTTANSSSPAVHRKPQDKVVRGSPVDSPGNQRVTAIVSGAQRNTKRDSEISNASSTASGRRKRTIGRWHLGKTVGRGGSSTVRLVRHQDTGQIAAVKIISRAMAENVRAQSLANLVTTQERSLQNLALAGKQIPPPPVGLMREIAIMRLLDHPNIVGLYDVWENHNEIYLVMEYVEGGELFHYVESNRGLDEKETVYIFRQIVTALLYCHRMQIHHRDLKPENVLLDKGKGLVKLVDFGMAALQPEGKQLSTACGSPHYAAPEVIASKPYDGAKADVWSCGVMLYVMLTGTTPFNYDSQRNLFSMYQAIGAARYTMPSDLSPDAQDLIRRILVAKPENRMSMDEVWDHPFMHKFDQDFSYTGELAYKDAWIGPVPQLDDWSVTREEDIDQEILRSMRSLWHSVPRAMLVKKLLSREVNQEKYFYAAILKHRDEHLENYLEGAEGLSYSPSDYRHTRPGTANPPRPQQSQSSYSIMNDEHLKAVNSADQPPLPSDGAIDAHRAKSPAETRSIASATKSTPGHRRGKSSNVKVNSQTQLRNPSTLRVETLRKANRQSVLAANSNTGAGRQSPAGHRRNMSKSSLRGASASRTSLSSSLLPSSPPVVVAVSGAHKRNVSFKHSRKASTAPSAAGVIETAPRSHKAQESQSRSRQPTAQQQKDIDILSSSPTERAAIASSARKSRVPSTPRSRHRYSQDTPGHYMNSQVRQVSNELEQACEEAFFRSSFGSSERPSITEKRSPYATPPSSVSNPTSGSHSKLARPLPALPTDTPNTFIARTLEETRSKLAARSAAENDGDTRKFEEILATLESIMPDTASDKTQAERRITSAPEPKSATDMGFLPIIKEEPLPESLRIGMGSLGAGHRSVTAPVPARQFSANAQLDTIRVVQHSPGEQRPLSDGSGIHRPKTADGSGVPGSTHLQIPDPRDFMLRKKSHDSGVVIRVQDESQDVPASETVTRKKSSWFRRWKDTTPAEPKNTEQSVPNEWQQLDERANSTKLKPNVLKREKQPPHPLNLDTKTTTERPPLTSESSDYTSRKTPEDNKKFSKWFTKLSLKEKDGVKIGTDLNVEKPPPLEAIAPFSATPPSPITPITPLGPIEPTRSFFARLLRLKPESRVLCFSVPRGRARTEIYRLLREWERHGISDLTYFPQDNAITACVNKVNALGIKPVSFRVELFVVLQNGRKVGLSLARWTQTRGAASSFKRVVGIVEEVLRQRGDLVEDEEKWSELEGILG